LEEQLAEKNQTIAALEQRKLRSAESLQSEASTAAATLKFKVKITANTSQKYSIKIDTKDGKHFNQTYKWRGINLAPGDYQISVWIGKNRVKQDNLIVINEDVNHTIDMTQ
jgi:hypothetical protein